MSRSLPQPSARERIVRAARVVFARGGFEATRVEDLLCEAGVSRPTFYRLFTNKQEVYQEVSEDEAPLERTALERVREGCREAFGQLGHQGAKVDDLIAASGVARSTFYRIFRNKEDAFVQLDRAAIEYLRRAIRRAAAHPDASPQELRFSAAAYVEWRTAVGASTVSLEHDAPLPRHPLAQWRDAPDLGGARPYPDRKVDNDAMDPVMVEALVVAIDRLARQACHGGQENRAAQVLQLIASATGARIDQAPDAPG